MSYKIFYINLDRSSDRRTNMEKQFKLQNINAFRFSAIDGKLFDKEFLRNRTTPKSFYYLDINKRKRLTHEDVNTKGQYAVFLSHSKLWQQLLDDKNSDYYVIFEDDVIIYRNFIQKLNHVIKNNPNFDFISLIYLSKRMNNLYNRYNDMYLMRHPFFGMQCYVISKDGAKKLLKYVDKIDCHVDAYVGYVAFYDNLNALMINDKHMLGESGEGESTINHGNCLFCKEDYGSSLVIPTAFRFRNIYSNKSLDIDYLTICLLLFITILVIIINIKK